MPKNTHKDTTKAGHNKSPGPVKPSFDFLLLGRRTPLWPAALALEVAAGQRWFALTASGLAS
jgi:hypothetical protein